MFIFLFHFLKFFQMVDCQRLPISLPFSYLLDKQGLVARPLESLEFPVGRSLSMPRLMLSALLVTSHLLSLLREERLWRLWPRRFCPVSFSSRRQWVSATSNTIATYYSQQFAALIFQVQGSESPPTPPPLPPTRTAGPTVGNQTTAATPPTHQRNDDPHSSFFRFFLHHVRTDPQARLCPFTMS